MTQSTPAVPEGKYVEIGDGLRVHYHEQGSGPPVIFLHGSGPGASGWSNFKHNYPYFAERGLRAIVPDTLGYGYSSKPERVEYTLDFLAGGVQRFIRAMGIERCALVGNSHGGALALRVALDRPDLISKVVVMAPGGLEEREAYMKMEGIRAMLKAFLGPDGITRENMRHVFGLQLFDPKRITAEIIEERYQIAVIQPKQVLASMAVPLLAPELPKLKQPLLGFWGANDKFCPVSGALILAQNVKQARVTLVSECGHWVMVEHPELFNRTTVDFLREEQDPQLALFAGSQGSSAKGGSPSGSRS